jgi:hypothetical protein
MLPLTGAELFVVMLSLRAFEFYLNSVEFYGQSQVAVFHQDSVYCHPLSCFDCPQTGIIRGAVAGLQTIEKGDRIRYFKQIPEFEKTPRHRFNGTWRLSSCKSHMCQIRCQN